MTIPFRLPDLGEGIHEAEILAIHVTIGQAVREGEPFVEVETDKAAVEIPAPLTGTIAEILVRPGDIVRVGTVLLGFAGEKGAGSAESRVKGKVPVAAAATGETPESADAIPAANRDGGQPVPASPATRRLARELGVDLRQIVRHDATSVISATEVRAYAEAGRGRGPEELISPLPPVPVEAVASGEPADFTPWGPVIRQPFQSIRRATAMRMSQSWARIPHVNCQDRVDITRLEEFREKHKAEIKAAGGRLTMTVFAMKAAATALKMYPHFNASLDEARQEIIIKQYYHIGIATDTDHGLVVPVVRDVDRKSIRELAIEVAEAVDRARKRKSSREEMVGGTFTITNVGGLGGGPFSAIINAPEVAILGLGQGRLEPTVVVDDHGLNQIVPRLQMPIVLCFDHRVVDGADAVRFLRQIIALLTDPEELLMTMI